MKPHLTRLLFAFTFIIAIPTAVLRAQESTGAAGADPPPLKVLLLAGGCCHDYETQTKLLKEGIESRIRAEVTVEYNPSRGTDARFDIYDSDDWAQGYDVVIHDECSASVTERPYVDRILEAHRSGVPAVNLHCAMHSYRWGDYGRPVEPGAENAIWFEMLGVQSTAHGPQRPIDVTYADDHPITAGLEDWTTINEELYNNVRVFSGTQVLAHGNQRVRDREATAVIAWTNEYGPNRTRIFSTSLGHNNETVGDPRYLDLVTRGLLWATGHLGEGGQGAEAYLLRSEARQGSDAE